MYSRNAGGLAAKFERANLFLLYAGSRHMCKRRDAPSRKQPLRHFLQFSDFPLRSDIPSPINFPDRRGTRWATSRQLTASTTGSPRVWKRASHAAEGRSRLSFVVIPTPPSVSDLSEPGAFVDDLMLSLHLRSISPLYANLMQSFFWIPHSICLSID